MIVWLVGWLVGWSVGLPANQLTFPKKLRRNAKNSYLLNPESIRTGRSKKLLQNFLAIAEKAHR